MSAQEKTLDLVDCFFVTKSSEDISMEVHLLSTHATDVERNGWTQFVVGLVHVFVNRHIGHRQDFEVVGVATRGRSGKPFIQMLGVHFFVTRCIKDREPTISNFGGQRHILRTFGADEDRQVNAQRMSHHIECLTKTKSVGCRNRVLGSGIGEPFFARQNLTNDVDVLTSSRQWLVESLAVPTFNNLRTTDTQPKTESSARQVIHGDRGHGGRSWRTGRQLHDVGG